MINDSTMNNTNEAGVAPTNDFLMDGILKEEENTVGNTLSGKEISEYLPEQKYDYSSCSPTELRGKFPRTYKCWGNMKQRRKKGAIIHKAFEKFSDFLMHLGPCENSQYTLDRVDNSDPEYAPGKVAWRDKYAQNSNKSNNVYLTHEDGRRFTVAQWAAITSQKAPSLYKRKAAGWNDMAIITGIHEGQNLSMKDNPWPHYVRQGLEAHYRKTVLAGSGKSRLDFLLDIVSKEIPIVEKRLYLLAMAKKDKIGYDDESGEYDAQENLSYMCCDLDEFKEMSIEDIDKMYKNLESKKDRCMNILKQVKDQVEYENRKREMLHRKHESISMSDFLKYFNEEYPRPAYTINIPTQLAKL